MMNYDLILSNVKKKVFFLCTAKCTGTAVTVT